MDERRSFPKAMAFYQKAGLTQKGTGQNWHFEKIRKNGNAAFQN